MTQIVSNKVEISLTRRLDHSESASPSGVLPMGIITGRLMTPDGPGLRSCDRNPATDKGAVIYQGFVAGRSSEGLLACNSKLVKAVVQIKRHRAT